MKTLKFKPELISLILDGSKVSTWRLFDDKDLNVGDELEFKNSETGQVVAYALIDSVIERKLGDLSEEDKIGHEKYSSPEEMYETLSKYYQGKGVNEDTLVKIIHYHLIEKPTQS